MLEQGDAFTLDRAVTILRTAETSQLQAANLQEDHTINAIVCRSTTAANRQTKRKKTDPADFVEKIPNTSEKIVRPGGRNVENAAR